MKNIINNLRNKPDHIKSRYVIVFSIIATTLTVALWIVTMQLSKTSDDTIKTESPLRAFGQIFSETVSDVKNNYDNQKSSLDQVMLEQSKASVPAISPTQAQVNTSAAVMVPESEILNEDNDIGR